MKEALVFGKFKHLLGIFEGTSNSEVAVLFWNVGVIDRVGPYRHHYELSQLLVGRGFATFRFDAGGRGSSEARSDISKDFSRTIADVHEAIELLKEKFGIKQFIIYGHCSSAVEGHVVTRSREEVIGLIMIDSYSYTIGKYRLNYYKNRLFSARRLLHITKKMFSKTEATNSEDIFEGIYPPLVELQADMDEFIARKLPLYVQYTGGVEYNYNYKDQFFDMFPKLSKYENIELYFEKDSDHLISTLDERNQLTERLLNWFDSNFPQDLIISKQSQLKVAETEVASFSEQDRIVTEHDPNISQEQKMQLRHDKTKEEISEIIKKQLAIMQNQLGIMHTQLNLLGSVPESSTISQEGLESIIRAYKNTLDSSTSDSENPASSLKDRNLGSYEFNNTTTSYERDAYVHDLLIKRFQKTPKKIAIWTANESITYGELSVKAQSIAQNLIEMGVAEGDCVAICCHRSPDMVAAMIATLLCGATYIPMDPSFPKERLGYMVEDTGLEIILTDLDDRSMLPSVKSVIDLRAIEEKNFTAPILKTKASELLAYMIFTSGSTGRPKGVMVQHQAMHNFLDAVGSAIEFTEDEKLLAVTTISFDISVLEIFLGLFNGASFYLATKEESSNGLTLKAIIEEQNISMMQGTPSTWKILLGSEFSAPEGFRALCGGEPLSKNLATQLTETCDELWNMYGPTEATVWSSCELITKGFDKITVGKPLNNYQYYILDEDLRPVPMGSKGKLFIGGDSVSKGYLDRDELNREVFREVNGETIYNTGDIARFDSHGNVELFGRGDHQVKIRGYRIELGEIEEKIKELDGVIDCIVKVFELNEDDKRMVAFLTSKQEISASQIRSGLREKSLPPYMIPNKFIQLAEMPLLPNGKIDRKALHSPFNLPKEETNTKAEDNSGLLELWERTLGTKVVPDSNFFDLGGHSMLASQMLASVNRQFGTQMSIKDLFTNVTFREFSAAVETSATVLVSPESEKIIPITNDGILSLSDTQKRIWYVEQIDEGSRVHSLPGAWSVPAETDLNRLEMALKALVTNNDALRFYVDDSQGEPTQGYVSMDHGLVIPRIKMQNLEEARSYMEEKKLEPIDIFSFPAFDLEILELTNGNDIIYFNKHHIIWDGWSVDLFLEKLNRYYNNLDDAKDKNLTRYRDYSVWADNRKKSSEYKNNLNYWKQKFAVMPEPLNFPSSKNRPEELESLAYSYRTKIAPSTLDKVEEFKKENGITDFMFYLGVYYLYLVQKSERTDLVIGTPVHGRNIKELEKILGVFISVMPLRLKDLKTSSLTDYFSTIKQICLDGFAHSDVSIEDIVASLSAKSPLHISDLYSVMFSFQNIEGRSKVLGNGNMDQIYIPNDIVHSEQVLWIQKGSEETFLTLNVNRQMWIEDEAKTFAEEYLQMIQEVLANAGSSPAHAKSFQVKHSQSVLASDAKANLDQEEAQKIIKSVWTEMLGESEIDLDDNFFALGGHSLLAIQAMNKINRQLNAQIKIRDFLNGTLKTLVLQATEIPSDKNQGNSSRVAKKKTVKSLFSSRKGR